ncbi:nucleoside deaminase [Paenibacillus turpanensis]|uniref:nucleoside deaminase n=1 Tax=Paenibacillus turpanensis TaxID=2689078 RepID=UPI00140DD348|nr:nucleoside deaminase [Paenibacillus turpanensis]
MSHETFLKRAVELAYENVKSAKGGPFGAVIVKDGAIIAEACNVVTETNDPTAHAEVQAIREACRKLNSFQLDDCIIYSSCEPCPMCIGAIYWARPKAVYYAGTKHDAAKINFDDQFIYEQLDLVPEQRSIPMKQMTIEDHLKPFLAWAESDHKTEY